MVRDVEPERADVAADVRRSARTVPAGTRRSAGRPAAGTGEERRPVDGNPVVCAAARVATTSCRRRGCGEEREERGVENVRAHRGQDRVRADLQELVTPGRPGTGCRRRTGRPPARGAPSTRASVTVGDAAGHIGHDRDRRLVVGQVLDGGRKSSSIGSISTEWNACDTFSSRRLRPWRRTGRPPRHRVLVAGDHHGSGPLTAAIDSTRSGAAAPRPRWPGSAIIAPPAGKRLHQPATRGDQRGRVGERQDPGHVRGRDLTDRVPGKVVRLARPTTRPAGRARPRWRTTRPACSGLVD